MIWIVMKTEGEISVFIVFITLITNCFVNKQNMSLSIRLNREEHATKDIKQ